MTTNGKEMEMAEPASDETRQDEVDERGPDPFLVALSNSLRPEVLVEATDELARVIRSVHEHGKKGSLTLKLDLTPMKNNPEVAEVAASVTGKPARPAPRATPMWPTEDGRLSRKDPRQDELPFGPRPLGAERNR